MWGPDSVYIPDREFLYKLIDQGVDTNGDSLIIYAEAEAVKVLDVHDGSWYGSIEPYLYSLIGVEASINLDTLICNGNRIKQLDISKNTGLTHLDCGGNALTSLDVSKNNALTSLDCSFNHLTMIIKIKPNYFMNYFKKG